MSDASTSGSKISSSATASPTSTVSPISCAFHPAARFVGRLRRQFSRPAGRCQRGPALPAIGPGYAAASAGSGASRLLVHRGPVDLLDGRVELGVELLVG